MAKNQIMLEIGDVSVAAILTQPAELAPMVIFVHGTDTTHSSPINNFVSDVLNLNNIATLIPDLLTNDEKKSGKSALTTELLTQRLIRFTEKAFEQFGFDKSPFGFLSVGTGAAAVLDATAFLGGFIKAIVCAGPKFDFAKRIDDVKAPVLMIEGSLDAAGIGANKKIYGQLSVEKKVEIIEGASQSFDEPGVLNEMANLASSWFGLHLSKKNVHQKVH